MAIIFKYSKSAASIHVLAIFLIISIINGSPEVEQPPTEFESREQRFLVKRQSMRPGEQLSPEMVTNPKPEYYQGEIIEDDVEEGDDSLTQLKEDIPEAIETNNEDISHPPNQHSGGPIPDSEPLTEVNVINPDPILDENSEEQNNTKLL
ncbi:unnamed protein product [Orchesella dallaii]|uniref:Uncharacterized protein n=1 Tax=Orchesella dallaii TaxID=48710 RepID=A0ABP1S0K3_9HEXA